MIGCHVNDQVAVRPSGKNLAHFIQRLSGNNYFFMLIGFLQLNLADGDTMSVRRYQLQLIPVNLKQLSCHQFIIFIVGNGEYGLPYHFL